jgi:hypothetical protein
MQLRLYDLLCPAIIGSIAFMNTGCKIETDRRSTVEMTVGVRHVKATSDKIASITFDNHNFVISFSAKKCIVERERVLYDGKEQAKIPAEATSIVIEYVGGNFSVVADGQTVRAASPPS